MVLLPFMLGTFIFFIGAITRRVQRRKLLLIFREYRANLRRVKDLEMGFIMGTREENDWYKYKELVLTSLAELKEGMSNMNESINELKIQVSNNTTRQNFGYAIVAFACSTVATIITNYLAR